MRRPSLRWLMVLPTLAVVTFGFGAFAVYLDDVQRSNLIADIDDELARAERGTEPQAPGPGNRTPDEQIPEPDDPPDEATSGATVVTDDDVTPPVQLQLSPDGELLGPPSTNPFDTETLQELVDRSGTFTVVDARYRVLVTHADDGSVRLTALSLERFDESIDDFRQTLLLGGLVILLLVAGVIWLLTTLAVRPVTRMASTATRIADGELQTDVIAPSASRETADLAVALDLMLIRLRSTIDDNELAAVTAGESRDAMRRFLADVSHELRTPLTALKGYSDLYAGGMLDEPDALDRAMLRIGHESERLNGLVTDMLQLARETPADEPVEHFDAAEIVAVIAADLRAAHSGVEIALDVPAAAHSTVAGRPERFHQAILNLGSNACHHTAPGTEVRFEMTATNSEVVVRVIDHGPGVAPGEADRVFLPFYRSETSRTPRWRRCRTRSRHCRPDHRATLRHHHRRADAGWRRERLSSRFRSSPTDHRTQMCSRSASGTTSDPNHVRAASSEVGRRHSEADGCSTTVKAPVPRRNREICRAECNGTGEMNGVSASEVVTRRQRTCHSPDVGGQLDRTHRCPEDLPISGCL